MQYIYSSSEWGDEKLGGRRRSGSGLLDATDKRRKKCEATILQLYNYIVLCIYPLGLLYFFCSQTSKKAQVVQLFRELPSASKEESSSIVNTNISKQVHRSYLSKQVGMSYLGTLTVHIDRRRSIKLCWFHGGVLFTIFQSLSVGLFEIFPKWRSTGMDTVFLNFNVMCVQG